MVVMQPRERVRHALCERTCELAAHLDQVESAELAERAVSARGTTRCVHLWRLRANLPEILARHIDQGLLEWTTTVEWQPREYESHWLVRPRSVEKASLLCEATVALSPAVRGQGTRVDFELTLPPAMKAPALQTIASSIVSNHFRQLIDATARLSYVSK
jgi:hypothetical protein